MLRYILNEQKKIKNILLLLGIFIGLFLLYTILDNFGYQSYALLGDAFGYNIVLSTIILNILISLISAFTISMTIINFNVNNTRTSGSLFASIGNVFALLFTGCASCGLSLLGAIGISIGLPTIMPGAVKFKFFALLVIILGLILVLYLINTSTCSIKKEKKNETKNSTN
jgi:uncharacterized protein YacL